MQRIFVTATNTDAGKTFVSALLLQGFRTLGVTSYALKPLASGCDAMGNNADITALLQGSHLTADDINLHRFTPAIAPHLAAAQCGISLKGDDIVAFVHSEQRLSAQVQLIEGAGGWLLPLSADELLSDVVLAAKWPVLLVVAVQLGCLNHALLTYRELARSGATIVGFVANVVGPMACQAENIAELQRLLPIPCLGVVPYEPAAPVATALAQSVLLRLEQLGG